VKKVATWAAFNDFEKIWKFYNLKEWKKEGVWYSDYKGGTAKLPLRINIMRIMRRTGKGLIF